MREIRQSGLKRGMVTAKAVAISTLLRLFLLWLSNEMESIQNAVEPYKISAAYWVDLIAPVMLLPADHLAAWRDESPTPRARRRGVFV